jgi:hypothetical protein
MKTWVIVGLVVVGGYLLYDLLFAPGGADEEQPPPRIELPSAPAAPSAVPKTTSHPEPALSLRLEADGAGRLEPPAAAGGGAEGPAWKLLREREEALRAGQEGNAGALAERILKEHPGSDPARWIGFERGREALREYRRLGRNEHGVQEAAKARRLLTPALFLADADPAERERLRGTLEELAEVVLLNNRHVEGVDRTYTPKSGDLLQRLCRKVFPQWGARVTPGFVCFVNGLPGPRHLRAGEPIKVPLGSARIVVAKGEFRLYFLFAGAYVASWPVGLGRDDSTPEAIFEVGTKIKNPDWYPRPGVKIPYGEPENILGTRWLGFKNTQVYRGFGIHGTPDPSSVGRQASSGCLRLLREDVERLYDWTPEGTPVEIRR